MKNLQAEEAHLLNLVGKQPTREHLIDVGLELIRSAGGTQISGCLLGNLSLEVAGQNAEVRALLKDGVNGWQNALAKTLREAVEEKELPRTARAEDLGALPANGWEGAQVLANSEQSDKPLTLFVHYAFAVLLRR